jgi:DNA-binding GntR family transcriptional regulator
LSGNDESNEGWTEPAANTTQGGNAMRATLRAIELIKSEISSGDLKAGDVVPEELLAQALGVSRTPVREAIGRLVEQGLLTKDGNRSARVFQPSLQDLAQIIEIRLPLETRAAELGALRSTDESNAQLKEHLHRIEDAHTGAQWSNGHEEFHRAIFMSSGNERMVAIIESLRLQSQPYIRIAALSDHRFRSRVRDEHEAMLRACIDRDPSSMRRLVGKHLNATATWVKELMDVGDWQLVTLMKDELR